jgi:transposase
MPQSRTLSIGRDVHKDAMAVAYVTKDHDAEVVSLGTIGTRPAEIAQLMRTMPSKATHRVFVSEAGPWGSWRSRYLRNKGPRCWVVAPSVIPQKAGDRVNTARRDAVPRARLRRSGDLPRVYVPTVEDETIRALSRARAEAIRDRKTATCRLKALLLRHDIRSTGRAAWGPAHQRWRSEVVCPPSAQPMVFQAYGRAVNEHTERLPRLAQALHDPVNTWRRQPLVEALQALRGVQCTVAVTRVAELGDLTRVDTPRQLMK